MLRNRALAPLQPLALPIASVFLLAFSGCAKDAATRNASTTTIAAREAPRAGTLNLAPLPLFDAIPLESWRVVGGAARFELLPPANGGVGPTLVGRGPIPQNGFLVSPRELGDFTLEIDVRIGSADNPSGEKMNSGIQIRSQEVAVDRAKSDPQALGGTTIRGLQIEIDPSPRAWSGGVYDERGRGWLAPLAGKSADGVERDNAQGRAAFRLGEWNRYRIECDGPRIRTSVNGVPCAEWLDSKVSGVLAFQVHGGPACEVAFRAPSIEERGTHAWLAWTRPESTRDRSIARNWPAGRPLPDWLDAIPGDARGLRANLPSGTEVELRFGGAHEPIRVTIPKSPLPTDPTPVEPARVPLVPFEVLWQDGRGVVRGAGEAVRFACAHGPTEAAIVLPDAARGAVPDLAIPSVSLALLRPE